MRTLFIDIACILTVFDIVAPEDETLQAKFNEEHLIRYVASRTLFRIHEGCR